MKLVALCGLHGAGKDTVADALPAQKFAFADALYREVADVFGVTVAYLKQRESKELPSVRLALDSAAGSKFDSFIRAKLRSSGESIWQTSYTILKTPRSPRQILQWWGDYRRASDPDYFINKCRADVVEHREVVITDCRFPNEAAMVRQLGGQIWQVVRPGHNPPRNGHASENDGTEFSPDVVIINNGTLEELRATALQEWNK